MRAERFLMPPNRSNALLDPELLERIKGLSLLARRVVEGVLHGLHRSPFRGLSVEFAQHREYSPGDELKRLDWQVLARSDRYVVKEYDQETNLRAVIFLDCSRSMAYGEKGISTPSESAGSSEDEPARASEPASVKPVPADARTEPNASGTTDSQATAEPTNTRGKFHYAQVMAAALSYLMLHQGDSVGLVLMDEQVRAQLPPRASPGHILSICRTLQEATPGGRTDLATVITQFAARLKRRSLLILISDLLDDPQQVLSALGQLHHRGHEVVVFQVLHPREIDFNLGLAGHGVTVIRDMETDDEFDAEPALVRELVQAEVRRFTHELDAGARRRGLHLIRCLTSDPPEQILSQYLHSRLKGKRRC